MLVTQTSEGPFSAEPKPLQVRLKQRFRDLQDRHSFALTQTKHVQFFVASLIFSVNEHVDYFANEREAELISKSVFT